MFLEACLDINDEFTKLLDFEDSIVPVYQSFEQPDNSLLGSLEIGAVVLLCCFIDQFISKLVFNSDCYVASFGLSESQDPHLNFTCIFEQNSSAFSDLYFLLTKTIESLNYFDELLESNYVADLTALSV